MMGRMLERSAIAPCLLFLTAGCSLDASILNQLDSASGSSSGFSLKPNSSIIFTEVSATSETWTYDNVYLSNPAAASAYSTAAAVSIGSVNLLSAPTVTSNVQAFVRPPGVSIANNPSDEAPYPSSFISDNILLVKDSTGNGSIKSARSCQLAPALPGVNCDDDSVSIPRNQLTSGILSISLSGGQIDLNMKKYFFSKVEFTNGATWGRLANPEHDNGGVDITDQAVLALSTAGGGMGCRLDGTTCKEIMYSSSGYDGFFAGPVVAGKRYFKAYKPGTSYTTLYIADIDYSNAKRIAATNASGNDISPYFNFNSIEFKSKVYFTLNIGNYNKDKLFRMNPDGSNVEQVTNFVPGDADGISNLIVFNGKLLFSARSSTASADQAKLFILDSNNDGTGLTISRLPSLSTSSDIGGVFDIDGQLYISGQTTTQGIGLYKVSSDFLTWEKIVDLEYTYSIEFFKEGGLWFAGMKENFADDMSSYFLFNPADQKFTLMIDLNNDGTTYNIGPQAFVVSNGRIYFVGAGEMESALFSTNLSGADLKVHTSGLSVGGKLTLIGDRIFFMGDTGSDADIYSLDPATGKDIVQHTDMGAVAGTLNSMYRIDANTLFFIGFDGFYTLRYQP